MYLCLVKVENKKTYMKIQFKNKIYSLGISVLMVIVLSVALGTFYFFMIQTSFGLSVSRARDAHEGLVEIYCFPKEGDFEESRDMMLDIVDDELKLKDYEIMVTYDNIYLYKNKRWDKSVKKFRFISDHNIRAFKPKVLEGSLDFSKRISRERVKVKNPKFGGILNIYPDKKKSDSLSLIQKYISRTVDLEKYGVIIPRSLADELFGEDVRALGREIYWYDGLNNLSEKVVCVYEDFPAYTGIKNHIYLSMNDDIFHLSDKNFFSICFDIKKNGQLKANIAGNNDKFSLISENMMIVENINKRINDYIENNKGIAKDSIISYDVKDPNYYHNRAGDSVVFNEETNTVTVYIHSKFKPFDFTISNYTSNNELKDLAGLSNDRLSMLYMFLAFAVLLTAIICMLNISLTSVPLEMKDINIRMVIGTTKRRIWLEQMFRYMLMSLIAFVITVFIIIKVDTDISYNMYKLTSISLNDNVTMVFITMFVALAIGALTGICTSRYSTSLPMDRVLKAKVGMDRRSRKWREIMLRVQFVLSFIPLFVLCHSNVINYIRNIYIFFSVSSLFIVFVTLLCMINQQERYMFRSMAIRKVLGTTNLELLKMDILYYSKLMLQSFLPIVVIIAVIVAQDAYRLYTDPYLIASDKNILASVVDIMAAILVVNIIIFVMEQIIIIPVVINRIISRNEDLSNALKAV